MGDSAGVSCSFCESGLLVVFLGIFSVPADGLMVGLLSPPALDWVGLQRSAAQLFEKCMVVTHRVVESTRLRWMMDGGDDAVGGVVSRLGDRNTQHVSFSHFCAVLHADDECLIRNGVRGNLVVMSGVGRPGRVDRRGGGVPS